MGERKTEQGIRDAGNADPEQKRSAKARTVFDYRQRKIRLMEFLFRKTFDSSVDRAGRLLYNVN